MRLAPDPRPGFIVRTVRKWPGSPERKFRPRRPKVNERRMFLCVYWQRVRVGSHRALENNGVLFAFLCDKKQDLLHSYTQSK